MISIISKFFISRFSINTIATPNIRIIWIFKNLTGKIKLNRNCVFLSIATHLYLTARALWSCWYTAPPSIRLISMKALKVTSHYYCMHHLQAMPVHLQSPGKKPSTLTTVYLLTHLQMHPNDHHSTLLSHLIPPLARTSKFVNKSTSLSNPILWTRDNLTMLKMQTLLHYLNGISRPFCIS